MKKLITTAIILFVSWNGALAQYTDGSIGIGFFAACPQNELKDIGYDDGFGMNFSYLSKRFGHSAPLSFQWGVRMDVAAMDHRDFDPVEINTPIPDNADLQVNNSMYGFFGTARLNFGSGSFTPYIEGLVGHRNFNTKQIITAQNPNLNPEYEATTTFNKVVHTKRFHYGGSVGLTYHVGNGFYLESSVTYTEGNTGAVMPLQDITQEGDYLNYNHRSSETDMLLINVGVRIRLRTKNSSSPSAGPKTTTTPTNTRYKSKTSDPPTSTTPSKTTPEKKKLEVKPKTKPSKNGSGKS